MKLGIVGLPNVGKSTLFNAITNAGAQSANYPFCTIEPNVGMVAVPDERLDVLAKMYDPDKYTPAVIEFVDIAGLVRGASKGEGLGNKFLSHIREVDAIVHVVRCFEDGEIVHVDGEIGPKRDIETISLELIFSDIDLVDRKIDRSLKAAKGGDKSLAAQAELLKQLKAHLEEGKSARSFDCSPDEWDEAIADMPLLSAKPIIYAANMSENDFTNGIESNQFYKEVEEIAVAEYAQVLPICARIEEEIADMSPEDKLMFLEEMGLEESGVVRLIQSAYSLLNLHTFFTAGTDECRAWTINKGDKAPKAAGVIHTDFEKGFIRAEVIKYEDFISLKSESACRAAGKLGIEGKEYVVEDGDIMHFLFNV